jgi:hypothetical protein
LTADSDESMKRAMRLRACAGLSLVVFGCGGASGESKPAAGAPNVDEPDRGAVIDMVQEVREDKGRRSAEVVEDPGALAEVVKAIEGGTKPDDATKAATERLAASGTPGVDAACSSNDNLGELEIPKVVVEREALKMAVVVVRQAKSPKYTACFLAFPGSADDEAVPSE